VIPSAISAATGAPAPNAGASTPEVRAAHGERAISDNSSDDDGGAKPGTQEIDPAPVDTGTGLAQATCFLRRLCGAYQMHREPPAKLVVAGGVERFSAADPLGAGVVDVVCSTRQHLRSCRLRSRVMHHAAE